MSPGIPCPANLTPGPSPRSRIFQFSVLVDHGLGSESRIFLCVPVPVPCPGFFKFQSQIPKILNLSPGPSPGFNPGSGPRFSGPGLRDAGDPVPDADPCVTIMRTIICNSMLIYKL